MCFFFFFKQKTAYELRISDWSSDWFSSDLGTIYQGRTEGMDQWKSAHAVPTEARNLTEALKGADVFLGPSAAGALKPEMVQEIATAPIIFATANPAPEIPPHDSRAARTEAHSAPGRSANPNQVHTLLRFPPNFPP